MADFSVWSRENLVRFCEESERDRNAMLAAAISQANKYAAAMVAMKAMTDLFEKFCDMFCCKAERYAEYRNAMEVLK